MIKMFPNVDMMRCVTLWHKCICESKEIERQSESERDFLY